MHRHAFAAGEGNEVTIERGAVHLVLGHAGLDAMTLSAVIDTRPDGLVLAGTGNGNLPTVLHPLIAEAVHRGIVVLRASRGLAGTITRDSPMFPDTRLGTLTAGRLSPQKARVLLLLALAAGTPRASLQALFDADGRYAIGHGPEIPDGSRKVFMPLPGLYKVSGQYT